MVELIRRSFLKGLGAALFVAPAIVRASSLMPVKVIEPVNIDEMVALLQLRLEASEREMARQMAQSLYSDVHGSGAKWPTTDLASLTEQVERDGWWKHEEHVAVIQSQVPYLRTAPKFVRNAAEHGWKLA